MKKIRNFVASSTHESIPLKNLSTIMTYRTLIFLSSLFLTTFIWGKAPSAVSDRIDKILKLDKKPEMVIDSALFIIMSECADSNEGFLEGELAMAKKIIPYAKAHSAELSLFKQSEIFCQYAMLCGQQGKERFEDAQALNSQALDFARRAKDYYMIGFVLDRMAIFEERYGSSLKSFEYIKEAIVNYKKAPENTNNLVASDYHNLANRYLRIKDLDGIKQILVELEDFISHTDDKHRDFLLYTLYNIKTVYFSSVFDQNADGKLLDSINTYSSATIRLYETSSDEMLRNYTNPVWIYYNRAQQLIDYYDHPDVDSVEFYLHKMTKFEHYTPEELDFETYASMQQLRAAMWSKLGQYSKAQDILIKTIDEIKLHDVTTTDLIVTHIDMYETLREISEKSGHYKEALVYADSITSLNNHRMNNEHRDAIKDIEIKYRTQETELALTHSEAKRANTLMWLFAAIGLLLLSLVLFVLYVNRQRRKNMQREIEFANLRDDIGRQLTRQYVEGLENERQRMSRELHDGVCNDLLAIRMNIRNGKPLEETTRLIDNCQESVRRISHELMPPEFAYASIDEVVRFFVNKQADANAGNIEIKYNSFCNETSWGNVPDSVSLEIYRIIQEAVGNAIKHSGASVINVSLELRGDCIEANVHDNGIYKALDKKGLGMDSIQRRAKSINGKIELNTTENKGTNVHLIIRL